jgi:hypothetical protein
MLDDSNALGVSNVFWHSGCDQSQVNHGGPMRSDDQAAGDLQDGGNRSRYRDNDDQRAPLEGDSRLGVSPDSGAEAKGDAREAVGNNARATDASPTGPEGNDKTRRKPKPDEFDEDLHRS